MLSQIAVKKKERVEEAKLRLPLSELKKRLADTHSLRSFEKALLLPGMSVIAEVKKASPSKGNFRLQIPVSDLAKQYEQGGARAISVLTEEDYFFGHIDDLRAVRNTVKLPILRKDFVVDSYQIYESRYFCADAILLIAGFLSLEQLREYLGICTELGLDALVEAHSETEIELALQVGTKILGINNRDLKTFRTDVNHTVTLASFVPAETVLVSESGIRNAADVQKLKTVEVDAILVGETLVRANDPAAKVRELTGG